MTPGPREAQNTLDVLAQEQNECPEPDNVSSHHESKINNSVNNAQTGHVVPSESVSSMSLHVQGDKHVHQPPPNQIDKGTGEVLALNPSSRDIREPPPPSLMQKRDIIGELRAKKANEIPSDAPKTWKQFGKGYLANKTQEIKQTLEKFKKENDAAHVNALNMDDWVVKDDRKIISEVGFRFKDSNMSDIDPEARGCGAHATIKFYEVPEKDVPGSVTRLGSEGLSSVRQSPGGHCPEASVPWPGGEGPGRSTVEEKGNESETVTEDTAKTRHVGDSKRIDTKPDDKSKNKTAAVCAIESQEKRHTNRIDDSEINEGCKQVIQLCALNFGFMEDSSSEEEEDSPIMQNNDPAWDTRSVTAESGFHSDNGNIVDIAAAICSVDGVRRMNGRRAPVESVYTSNLTDSAWTEERNEIYQKKIENKNPNLKTRTRVFCNEESERTPDGNEDYNSILVKSLEKSYKEKPWLNNTNRVNSIRRVLNESPRITELYDDFEKNHVTKKHKKSRRIRWSNLFWLLLLTFGLWCFGIYSNKAEFGLDKGIYLASSAVYANRIYNDWSSLPRNKPKLPAFLKKHFTLKPKPRHKRGFLDSLFPPLKIWNKIMDVLSVSGIVDFENTDTDREDILNYLRLQYKKAPLFEDQPPPLNVATDKRIINAMNNHPTSFDDPRIDKPYAGPDEPFLYFSQPGDKPGRRLLDIQRNPRFNQSTASLSWDHFGNNLPLRGGLKRPPIGLKTPDKDVLQEHIEKPKATSAAPDPPIGESTRHSQPLSELHGTFGLRDKTGKYIGPKQTEKSTVYGQDPSGKPMQYGPVAMNETSLGAKINYFLEGMLSTDTETKKVGRKSFSKSSNVTVQQTEPPPDPKQFMHLSAELSAINVGPDQDEEEDEDSVLLLNAGQYGFTGPVMNPIFSDDARKTAIAHLIGGRPFVNITLNDHPKVYCALYDTGASVSVISNCVMRELEDANCEMVKCPHDLEVKTYGGNTLNHIGSVLLAVGFKGPNNKSYAIHVPFVIVNKRTDPPVILGGPQIMESNINLDMLKNDKMALVMQDSGEIISECILKNTAFHTVCSVEPVTIKPDDITEVVLKIPHHYKDKNPVSNWNGKRVLVELNSKKLSKYIDLECVSVMENSEVRAYVFSKTKNSMVINPYELKAQISLLDREDLEVREVPVHSLNANAWGNAGTNLMKSCPCDLANVLVLGNCHAISGLGYDFEGRNLTEGFATSEKTTMRMIPVKKGNFQRNIFFLSRGVDGYGDIIPEINDKFKKAGLEDRCEINLLYQAPTLLSNDVFRLVQEMGSKYVVNLVNMDISPASHQWEKEVFCCDCASLRLQYLLEYDFTSKIPCVQYIIPDISSEIPSDLLMKDKGSADIVIRLGGFHISCFVPNRNKFSFFFHLENPETYKNRFNTENDPEAMERVFTNLFYLLNAMVKPLFPLARIDAKVCGKGEFSELMVRSLRKAHEMSVNLDSYLNLSRVNVPKFKMSRLDNELEPLSIFNPEGTIAFGGVACPCVVCSDDSYKGEQQEKLAFSGTHVALGRWPTTPKETIDNRLMNTIDIMEIVAYPDPAGMEKEAENWDTNCVFNGSVVGSEDGKHVVHLDVKEGYDGTTRRNKKTMPEDPMSFFPLPQLSEEERRKAHAVLTEYSDVISYYKDDTTEIKNYNYRPVLRDYQPFFGKPYRLSEEADRALSAIVAHNLQKGIIAPIRFPQMVFSAFVVRKNSQQKMQDDVNKNNDVVIDHSDETEEETQARLRKEYRLILDVREFNKKLIPKLPNHTIVSVHDSLSKLKYGCIYCSCDIREFFLSLRVDPSCLPYLCFSHKGITYTHLMAPPGVADLPAFTTLILTRAISPCIAERIARHIDDCAWSSETFEDALHVLEIFLSDMRSIGVLLSAQKMQLFTKEIEFLGFVVKNERIYVPERRKEHIKSIPLPKDKGELSKFLGTTGFVSHYIKDYSAYTSFLFPLLSDKVVFKMDPIQVNAFNMIKKQIAEVDGLYFFNPKLPLNIAVDASYIGGGAVFWQTTGNHNLLLQYSSFKFTPTEIRTMSSGTKEAMAITKTLMTNKILVQSGAEVIVHTDFRALVSVFAYCNVAHSTTLQRWMSLASSLCPNLKLVWKKGTSPELAGADYMSRLGLSSYRTKFSLSREVGKRVVDALTDAVDVPDTWKMGDYKVTFAELEKYATNVAHSPVSAKVLKNVAGMTDEQLTGFDEEAVERMSVETTDNGATPPGQVSALAFMAPHAMKFEEIIEAQMNNTECQNKIASLKQRKTKKNATFEMVGSLLCKIKGDRRLIVLPALSAIKMLCIMHLFAHSPPDSLMKQFRFHYYTNNLRDKATLVCNVCKACRVIKMPYKKRYPPGITQRANRYRQILSIDHFKISSSAMANRDDNTVYTHVISFTDQFTRFSWVKPVRSTLASDTAQALLEFFSIMGPWEEVHSDGGPGMASNAEVHDVLRDLGIRVFVGIPNHPTGHYVEGNNKHLRRAAMLIAAATNRNAVDCVQLGCLAVNMIIRKYPTLNHKNELGFVEASAFQMVFGRSAIPNTLTVNPEPEDFEALFDARDKLHEEMSRYVDYNIERHRRMDERADEVYEVGDLILLVDETTDKNSKNRFFRNVYRVTRIEERAVYAKGIFGAREEKSSSIDRAKKFYYSRALLELDAVLKKFFGPDEEPLEGGPAPEFVYPPVPTSRLTRNLARKRQQERRNRLKYVYNVDHESNASTEPEHSREEDGGSATSGATGLTSFLIGPPIDLADEVEMPDEPEDNVPDHEVVFRREPSIDWTQPQEEPEKHLVDDFNHEEMNRTKMRPSSDISLMGAPENLSIVTGPRPEEEASDASMKSNKSELLLAPLGYDNNVNEVLLSPGDPQPVPEPLVHPEELMEVDDASTTLSKRSSNNKSVRFQPSLSVIGEENENQRKSNTVSTQKSSEKVEFSSWRTPDEVSGHLGPSEVLNETRVESELSENESDPVNAEKYGNDEPEPEPEKESTLLGPVDEEASLGTRPPSKSEFTKSMRSKMSRGISNLTSRITKTLSNKISKPPTAVTRASTRTTKRPKYLEDYI